MKAERGTRMRWSKDEVLCSRCRRIHRHEKCRCGIGEGGGGVIVVGVVLGRAVQCFECEETCYRNRPERDSGNSQRPRVQRRRKNGRVIAANIPSGITMREDQKTGEE